MNICRKIQGHAHLFRVSFTNRIVMKLKQCAKEHNVVVNYENIKAHIRAKQKWFPGKYLFFRPFSLKFAATY